MKTLKKTGGAILTIILLICALPWLCTTAAGSITGSFATAFMNGFKKGVFAMGRIQMNIKGLQLPKTPKESELKVEK